MPRYPAYGGRRTTDQDKTLAEWAHDLRRAFPRADGKSIETLTAICSLVAVPGGIPLIRQGEPPEAVYIVVTGQFAAYRTADTDQAEVDRFGAGDVFGDVGFFTGDAQTLTIQALRNSEVLRIAKQDLQAAAARWPGVLLAICSGAVQRLQRVQAAPMKTPRFHTFCFVPADAGIDAAPVVQKIADTLTAFGKVAIVSAEHAADRTTAWFADIEKSSDFVLLQADGGATAWTRFCLRHSDRIVLLAQGDSDPADSPGLGRAATDIPPSTPLYLMLLWQDVVVPARTTSWLQAVTPSRHYHIRSARDIERAGRLIAGRGLGLVLSGGGARALAHIGVIQALTEHDIPIDAVGGTSVGGIVAAVFALEWNLTTTVRGLAMAFNRRRFSDFAVPRTALYSERPFVRTLGHCFGTITIEDAPIPMFCVSTNLTKGISAVHRTGPFVTWLRATSAVPGICPPIIEQNAVYVDGGVLNNMPTDAMHDLGVAAVIAVDVGASLEQQARADGETSLPNMLDLLWRVGTIGSDSAANQVRRGRDVLLKPAVEEIGLFDWNSHEKAIEAGHQAALERLDEIKTALARIH
ncbi:MAG: patatin-like phospholipase family protein [Rhodopila sp.]